MYLYSNPGRPIPFLFHLVQSVVLFLGNEVVERFTVETQGVAAKFAWKCQARGFA